MDFDHPDSTEPEVQRRPGVVEKLIPSAALGAGVLALIVLLSFAF